MAITQAVCNSFKRECLDGVHLSSHSYKIALLTSASSANAGTTSYTGISGEVASGGGYTPGGLVLTGRATAVQAGVGTLDFATPVWSAATITARGAIIYNDTLAGKNAVMIVDFGQDVISTNAPFTATMPASGAATSLIRFA